MKYLFYNSWHLGDNVLHIHFLRKLVDRYNCDVEYYVHQKYIPELNNLITNYPSIKLYPLVNIEPNMINAWIGNIYFNVPINEKFYYNEFYIKWFNYLSKKLGIENLINSMIIDWIEFQDIKPQNDYDILFINSVSLSEEYDYIESEDHKVVYELAKNNSIITTKKVPEIDCTLDLGFNLLDIAKLSIGVKTLIGVNTSPLHLCLNNRTLDYVDNVYTIAKSHGFNLNEKFHYANNIYKLKELLKII